MKRKFNTLNETNNEENEKEENEGQHMKTNKDNIKNVLQRNNILPNIIDVVSRTNKINK